MGFRKTRRCNFRPCFFILCFASGPVYKVHDPQSETSSVLLSMVTLLQERYSSIEKENRRLLTRMQELSAGLNGAKTWDGDVRPQTPLIIINMYITVVHTVYLFDPFFVSVCVTLYD